MERVLFGAPEVAITVMRRQIRVWSTVFLCNTETKVVMGPYMAVSEPGMHCAREAWKDSGRSFPAQVRVQPQGVVVTVAKGKPVRPGLMKDARVQEVRGWLSQGEVVEAKSTKGPTAKPRAKLKEELKQSLERQTRVTVQEWQPPQPKQTVK